MLNSTRLVEKHQKLNEINGFFEKKEGYRISPPTIIWDLLSWTVANELVFLSAVLQQPLSLFPPISSPFVFHTAVRGSFAKSKPSTHSQWPCGYSKLMVDNKALHDLASDCFLLLPLSTFQTFWSSSGLASSVLCRLTHPGSFIYLLLTFQVSG